ncbi:hydroxylamine reductase [Methanosarcina sp. UBA5]|uniref:hydroxylamine reductase n=1 Tax=Methanosarcina sp. UBA5 TaxID=1915593 RepID=UPI0025E986FB|nr:hydroxylamine reductase [Methanosarcina sp. UBA5]
MFCNQCQETLNVKGCIKNGVCGKKGEVADLQDRLIYVLKSIAFYNLKARALGLNEEATDRFLLDSFFATLTNTNFDRREIEILLKKGFDLRDEIKAKIPAEMIPSKRDLPAVVTVTPENIESLEVAVHSTQDKDIRSLRELLTYGLKGLAAYAHHAYVLGYKDEATYEFIEKGLVSTTDDSLSIESLLGLVMECGQKGVSVLALLDKANTETYGNPEPIAINIGVRNRSGILISGHDLRDLEQLLEQTKGTGIDVYTHGEMLPANAYPAFKKYDNFAGNYGNSWWKQNEEFEKFNGPILMTTNCIIPPRESYKNRIYTTGVVGFEGLTHIYEKENDTKDFTPLIEQAKTSKPPEPIESGTITAGFAHEAALSVADKIIDAVKTGKISRFMVIAGCDGRQKERTYYTDFVKALPKDTVILTAGCAKYRYNKLDLGDIGGIPRVLDAGQCNDSYSLVVIAQKLAKAFGLEDINDLPVSYNIAWYEQKAVLVLLALLSLGVKNITLGPTLPAFLSPNVVKVLVENFNLRPNTTVEEDMKVLLKQA